MDRVDEILFLYEDDRANMAVGGAVKAIAKRILKGKKKYDYKDPKQKNQHVMRSDKEVQKIIDDPKYKDYIFHVNKVLENIGAKDIKQIHVYNKSDLISKKIDNLDNNSFINY